MANFSLFCLPVSCKLNTHTQLNIPLSRSILDCNLSCTWSKMQQKQQKKTARKKERREEGYCSTTWKLPLVFYFTLHSGESLNSSGGIQHWQILSLSLPLSLISPTLYLANCFTKRVTSWTQEREKGFTYAPLLVLLKLLLLLLLWYNNYLCLPVLPTEQ